jgi:hypothetical protein
VDRIPVGVRFPTPVQTGCVAHPAPVQWVPGVFRGGKRLGHGVDHPPTSSGELIERVELYLYYPSVTSWHVIQCTLFVQLKARSSAVGWAIALQTDSIPDSAIEIFH